MAKKKDDNTKVVSILSYLVIGLIWYLFDESVHDKKTKFHVKQVLVLLICYVAAMIVAQILFFISFILVPVVEIATLVLVILGIVNAANDKEKNLPLIGDFAKMFKF